jgi:putative ubiquitin-RnfH superfamily antitoxin RatB of RatAB toxin-antitoxin module
MADPHNAVSNPAASICVEVAYAEAERQFLRRLQLPAGSTIADAIAAAQVERDFGFDAAPLSAGLWSKPAPRDTVLQEGDRVELYRPLKADPKDSRRRRAERAPLKKPR